MKSDYIAVCSKTSLPKIREFVQQQLRNMEVAETTSYQVVLAVDEACANSIIHQHAEDGKASLRICIYRDHNELRIELTDEGSAFPINKYQPQDLQEIIRKRKRGGLGIQLINKIMDKIEVIQEEKFYTYRFTKYL